MMTSCRGSFQILSGKMFAQLIVSTSLGLYPYLLHVLRADKKAKATKLVGTFAAMA